MRNVLFLILAGLVLVCGDPSCCAQTAVLRPAPKIKFPAHVDCNSPCHWDGGKLYLFNSASHPSITTGADLFSLSPAVRVEFDNTVNGGRWMEATWKDDNGTIYGWYHIEPAGLCPGTNLTAPKMGAARSTDNGAHWTDLGIILEARPNTFNCKTRNEAFIGGNGDGCVMLDRKKKYLYVFFGSYAGDVTEQGICVARMAWKDRDKPAGKVWKYHKGTWDEPGLGGWVTPFFPATTDIKRVSGELFWGPAVHWNTHLRQYVMMLNRLSHSPGWGQEGIYIAYCKDISDPLNWKQPVRLLKGTTLYPEVIGIDKEAGETDKLCGRQGRFYILGTSVNEIIFFRDGEDTSKLPPIYTPAGS